MNVIFFSTLCAQQRYAVADIPSELLKNSSAVIRDNSKSVELISEDQMRVSEKTVITVLNKKGLATIQPWVSYDEDTSVELVEAKVYDKNGTIIKEFQEKDFQDVSATGSNLYSDSRMKVLDFTPAFYPFTFEFKRDWRSSSTSFLPLWVPNPFTGVGLERSKYVLKNPSRIPLNPRVYNLVGREVETIVSDELISYEVRDLPAIEQEKMGPHYTEFLPMVRIAPSRFVLKGKRASISNWKDFGLWQYRQLLNGRRELPQSTIARVKSLVLGIDDPREKARIIYEYMQSRTRYVSVQIGIGGWQPTLASEVDKLGYGDCKGLTNYTMALFESQGIESYYTIVNSGPNGQDIDEQFVALQGNHVILTLPFEDERVFLECTNQDAPFNYLGVHTDNRKVLMVTPEGGVIINTHEYSEEDNLERITGQASLEESLLVTGEILQASSGVSYHFRYGLKDAKADEQDSSYKNTWSHLNDLRLDNIEFRNDKENIVFEESLKFETAGYCSKAGDRILLNPNLFRRLKNIPSKSKKRTQPVVIKRGYTERDEIRWAIPENYNVESVFEQIEINSQFGTYKAELVKDGDDFLYKREFILNSGRHPKETFNEYVDFIKEVAKRDRSKIVLIKK
ncbi:DUF3857 domain-containing protein [Aureitalea sp. L0-47]|nr:DUF3857 domain-containing protein [Aureitalea sp. L0-47]